VALAFSFGYVSSQAIAIAKVFVVIVYVLDSNFWSSTTSEQQNLQVFKKMPSPDVVS
jgi:hypothetical protein